MNRAMIRQYLVNWLGPRSGRPALSADNLNPLEHGRYSPYLVAALLGITLLAGCATTDHSQATGDLGVIVERADGAVQIVERSRHRSLATISGLGDLSHASVVFSHDARFAYVFGRDGGLTKLDLLERRIAKRVIQAGNSIGGAISQDGRLVVAQNYEPGGIRVFDADSLETLATIPAVTATGQPSKVVGLADLPGNRFAYALFEGGEIWVADLSQPRAPRITKFPAGLQPYDGLVSSEGRHYIAGLFGEDGLALLDTWYPERGTQRILPDYGKGTAKLPVYKMPHLRGWALTSSRAFLPAIGRHQVLVANRQDWREIGRIPVLGQPVFAMVEPSQRRVWVNFAFPDNDKVQVIDTDTLQPIATLLPGKAILHMEFSARGDEAWLSARDSNEVVVFDTNTLQTIARLPARSPSGIFFTWRAHRIGM
ncbi:cytochrome D1 domain-containing protein [Chitinivorax sp. B]|uniref:cytochrome D1 domain-containing protein n=1 Tax=Chitinivorax sp. B TaxID=2502235 RepID=UPI002017DED5|nr:cytochrome D1 domain-containing protein [Chitinivorax sp. B]